MGGAGIEDSSRPVARVAKPSGFLLAAMRRAVCLATLLAWRFKAGQGSDE